MVWVIVRETDEVTSIRVMKDVVKVTALSVDVTYHLRVRRERKEREKEREEREREREEREMTILIIKHIQKKVGHRKDEYMIMNSVNTTLIITEEAFKVILNFLITRKGIDMT